MFNEIYLQRFNLDGTLKKEVFKVPLSYGSKEKYITRLSADPDFLKSVSTVVPRISFEMTGISYDPSRKQSSLINNFALDANKKLNTQYAPVPYDFTFSLSIFVRNTEDGTQILEQILPFFRPDYTVSVNFIPEMDQIYDMPVILNSVSPTTDYEGDFSTTRLIIWDLEFTVKAYIWPPVSRPGQGLIGQFSQSANTFGKVQVNVHNRVGEDGKVAEVIIQSDPLDANPDDEFGFSETINEFYSGSAPPLLTGNTADLTYITTDSTITTTDRE
jgi:hypothetical protein